MEAAVAKHLAGRTQLADILVQRYRITDWHRPCLPNNLSGRMSVSSQWKSMLCSVPEPPEPLATLLTENSSRCRQLRRHVRKYNCTLCLANSCSLG